MTQLTNEDFLQEVSEILHITNLPNLDEVSKTLTGSQLHLMAEVLAKSMELAYTQGKLAGIEAAKKALEEARESQD